MAEEQRCEEGNRLCANNCASSAKIAAEKPLIDSSASASASASSSSPPSLASSPSFPQSEPLDSVRATVVVPPAAVAAQEGSAQLPSRCGSCRKRVGMVGFRCRCGSTYCGAHRYPEKHRCTFDFKSAGREAIARANPVVKADKLAGRI